MSFGTTSHVCSLEDKGRGGVCVCSAVDALKILASHLNSLVGVISMPKTGNVDMSICGHTSPVKRVKESNEVQKGFVSLS